jgi:hypothetical protein
MTKGFMEQNGIESMSHLPYSPDLVSSDFFLFRLVKKRLDQFECEDPNDLLEAITEILGTRQMDRLQRVLQKWIERVWIGAAGDRGSIPDSTIHSDMAIGDLCSVGLAQKFIPRSILFSLRSLLFDSRYLLV